MFFKILVLISLLAVLASAQETSFVYNGFQSDYLSLDGMARITSDDLLSLGYNNRWRKGHAFYPDLVQFKNSPNGSVFSFSTTFVFAIQPRYETLSGHGIVFVVVPKRGFPRSLPSQYLGMFNQTNNSNATNHVPGVELDTLRDFDTQDIDDNHVGIDLNGLISAKSAPAGYYADGGKFMNLTLVSGKAMQVWVDYDGTEKQINVTLAPFNVRKPNTPLLSLTRDLASIINGKMYVGFSSSIGLVAVTSQYVLGWSFGVNGEAGALALSQLPKLPQIGKKETSKVVTIGLPWVVLFVISVTEVKRSNNKFDRIKK